MFPFCTRTHTLGFVLRGVLFSRLSNGKRSCSGGLLSFQNMTFELSVPCAALLSLAVTPISCLTPCTLSHCCAPQRVPGGSSAVVLVLLTVPPGPTIPPESLGVWYHVQKL